MSLYPEHAAGWKGQETSRAAAELQNKSLQSMRALVLEEFEHGPGTPEEIHERLAARGHELWFMTVRCRVSDLGKLGKVVQTGERRQSKSGRAKSLVWRKASAEELAVFEAQREATNV